MKDLFCSIDFVSKDISLFLKGKTKVSSLFGATVSLVLLTVFTAISIYLGKEMFERSNPISRFDIRNLEETKIPLKEFPVAFSVFGVQEADLLKDSTFLSAFDISPLLLILDSNRQNAVFSGKIKECSEELTNPTFFAKLQETKPHLTKMCADMSTLFNFFTQQIEETERVISKPFGYEESSTLTFSFAKCNPTKPNCSQYKAEANIIYVVFYSENSFVDVSNFDSPVEYAIGQTTFGMNPSMSIRQIIGAQMNSLVTDSGWVFESNDSSSWFSLGEQRTEINEYDPLSRGVLGVSFTGPTRQQIYHRQYLKLQQLFANLGGFFKAMMIISKFVVGFYSDFIVYITISNILLKEPAARNRVENRAENVVIRNNQDRKEQINNSITNLRNSPNRPKPSFIQFILSKISSSVRTKHKIDKLLVRQSLDVSGLICMNQKMARENIREPI